jgi:hypothetical protein
MKSSIQIVRRLSTAIGLAGAALVLAVPVAWGNGQPYRDAGDATTARLALHPSPVVIRDADDATAAKLALHPSPVVIRDAGDATAAKLALHPSPVVIRDAGDATAANAEMRNGPRAGRSCVLADSERVSVRSLCGRSPRTERSAGFGVFRRQSPGPAASVSGWFRNMWTTPRTFALRVSNRFSATNHGRLRSAAVRTAEAIE